jgi:hypothetical protein
MHWLRKAAGAVVLLVCAAALSITPGGTAAAAAPEYEVSAATLADLADVRPGDRVRVEIKFKVPGAQVAVLTNPQLCPSPLPDGVTQENYPTVCKSVLKIDVPDQTPPDPDGTFRFTITVPPEGENTYPASDTPALSCEPGRRCSVGFTILYLTEAGDLMYLQEASSLAFTVKEPNAFEGCEEPKPGEVVDMVGPHRLAPAYVGWVQSRCGGGKAIDMEYTANDDVTAREGFRDGQGTVFLGGGGATVGEPAAAVAKRPSVGVPVALNAQVLAITGQYPALGMGGLNRPAYIDDIKLTPEQFAELVTTSGALVTGRHQAAVKEANPQLATLLAGRLQNADIAAYATREVGHWVLSRHLARHAPQDWRYPNVPSQYDNPGEAIGELWRLDVLNPSGGRFLSMAGDRVGLGKILDNQDFVGDCGSIDAGCLNFVLTDAATAAHLGLPVVKLRNAAGEYVAPTPATMTAAAGQMKRLPDGTLAPDPAAGGQGAYPLTYVEYAHAPACTGLEGADRVRDVLGYMAGAGQQRLPAGFAALPEGLKGEAAQAVGKVGAQTTGPCAQDGGDPPGGGGPGGGGPNGGGPNGGTPVSNTGGATSNAAGADGNHPTRPVTTAGQQQALAGAQGTHIPLFAGLAALVLIVPISALVLTNAITSGTAYGTSGRHRGGDLLAWWAALRARTLWLARRARLIRR